MKTKHLFFAAGLLALIVPVGRAAAYSINLPNDNGSDVPDNLRAIELPALPPDTTAFGQTGAVTAVPTPEPATVGLLGFGALLLAARRRRSA